MTTIPLKSTFQQLQKIDVIAGKIFGNADHIRAQNTDGFSYAMGLGVRIVMVTTTAVLLLLTVIVIASLQEPTFTAIAGVGWALSLWFLSRAILPNDEAFAMTLIFELGFFPLIVFNTFMQYPGETFLEVYRSIGVFGWIRAFSPMLVLVFALSAGFSVLRGLSRLWVRAFAIHDSEEQIQARKAYRRAMRDFKRMHLNSVEQRNLRRVMIVESALVALMLMSVGGGVVSIFSGSIIGFLYSSILILICPIIMLPFAVIESRLDKRFLARLEAEGVPLPDRAAFGVVKRAPGEIERRIQRLFAKGGDRRD